jgi:hypothetical protein
MMTPSTFSANCCAKFPHGGEQIADDYLGDWSINTKIKFAFKLKPNLLIEVICANSQCL